MANKRGERPPSAPDALTAAGINRYVDEHGLEALFDYLHARYPRRRRGGAGRPMIDDTKRVARLEYHLLNDSDLIALLNRAGRASRAPSQRFSDARRAAREAARA